MQAAIPRPVRTCWTCILPLLLPSCTAHYGPFPSHPLAVQQTPRKRSRRDYAKPAVLRPPALPRRLPTLATRLCRFPFSSASGKSSARPICLSLFPNRSPDHCQARRRTSKPRLVGWAASWQEGHLPSLRNVKFQIALLFKFMNREDQSSESLERA